MATGNPDRSGMDVGFNESQGYGGAERSLLILLDRLGLSEETKLTMMDGRIFSMNFEKGELLRTDIVTCFFQDLSAKDQNALVNLRENYKKLGNEAIISSRDLMFAIFTCCDQFLLQQVLCKLVKCNSAVPVLMPDGKNENITFLLWGLRQCNDVLYDPNTKNYEDISFTQYPFMTISAIRFGKVDFSKSNILNSLLRSLHGFDVSESFLSDQFDPGTRVCSLGTVEYVPFLAKCKSATSLPMSFLNLRGDAFKYGKQLEFCCKNSQIVIVFSGIPLLQKFVPGHLRKLNPLAHIVYLFPNDANDEVIKGDRISIVTLKDPLKIVLTIKELILEVNGSAKFSLQPLNKMKLSCKDLGILADEECEKCLKARSAALELVSAIYTPQYAEKSKLFPLQDMWKEWSVLRERFGKDDDEPWQEREQRNELKLKQYEAPVSDEMLKLMAIVCDSEKELVNYFITWLQIFLRERSTKTLRSIISRLKENVKERRIVYERLGLLKSSKHDDRPKHRKEFQQNRMKNDKETINQKEYDEYQNFDAKVIEQEDFLREIGQMFECNRSIQLAKEKPISHSKMAEFAVDLLINGHCIELFENETGCIAVSWLKAICERLHTSLQNKPTVRVVSIIGGPSSGKSHLLNCAFGTNFNEGEGRCSRGVRLALVPIHSNIQKLTKCNFLIITDTESVNVSETTVAASKKKNNYISTLVACISDVVVIKIGKEDTPQEETGTFTIALRGLQRGRDVGEAPQACIVQSFDKTKLQPKQKDVFEKLKKVIQKVAKNGQVSTKGAELSQKQVDEDLLRCFFRISDETKRVKNIQFLSTPDSHFFLKDYERYSSDVKKFRDTLVQMLTKCSRKPRFFTEFGEHAHNVIKSMESDNFIEAFQAASFRKRCDAFLTQCEQTLSTIYSKLSVRTVHVSNDMISAVNNGKSIDDVKNLEQRVLQELLDPAISDINYLLRKIDAESKQYYFQPFLSDIQIIKTKVESFRTTQLENINANVKETITNINLYGKSVDEFNKKLSDTMADLDKTFIQSCDHLCTAEYSKIDALVKHLTKELTKQLNEKLVTLNDELEAIKRNEFKAHFESVRANFDLISSTYRTKVLDVLKARADEVNKVFTSVSQHEKDLSGIQIELSETLSIMSSKLNEEDKVSVEILNQIIKEIETLANEKFNKIQTKVEDRINSKLFPHVHKRLMDERCLAHETAIQEARKQLKISADRIKETRALQVLTKTLKEKQEKREKYVLQFNAVLTTIQQDLEAKLSTFCRSIMSAKFGTIDKVCQSKEKEFKEIATEHFNTLLHLTSQEKGNSFEIKEYKSFEHSSKSVEERLLSEMKKQFQKAVSKAKKIKKRNERVLNETKHFIETIEEGIQTPKDNSKASIKNNFETKFKPFLSKMREKNPLPSIFRLKQDKEIELLSEIKERGTISDTAMPISDDLSAYTSTCNSVQSKKDVAKISKDFCSVNEKNEKDFNNLVDSLFELSKDFVNFEQNAYKIVGMIKQFEVNSTLFVDRICLFSLFCSKFISSSHDMHLKAELKHLTKKDSQHEQFKRERRKAFVHTKLNTTIKDDLRIEFTEPLNFSSLDSKAKYFCTILVSLEEKVIADTLPVTTVKNYSNLPLTIETLQRIDSCFMRMLPALKTEDMQHLHETVNDAKLAIIGKTMAKVSYGFHQYFSEICETAENSTLGSGKNEEVSAAVIKHLSAWSANLMAVKDLEETKETNVAIEVEQKERSCLINLYKQCDHTCDDLIAYEVCTQIENLLEDCIEEEFMKVLTTKMLTKYTSIGLKRTFIGTILKSFLETNDHKGCLQFVNNFNKLCDKWTLNFLASDCNKQTGSFIGKLNKDVINAKVETAITAVGDTKLLFENTDKKIKTWLNLFENSFNQKSNTQFFIEENVVLDTEGTINDPLQFSEKCIEILVCLKEELQNKRVMPEKGNLDATRTWLLSFPNDIHGELSKFIKGCVQQCPFCGHPCDKDLCEHDMHESSIHIPRGLKGSTSTKTNLLTQSICSAAVQKGTGKFRVKEIEGVWKDYKKAFPTWDISGGEDDCIPFWKYIFHKYNTEFSEYHERTAGFVEDWSEINESEASTSLHKTYLKVTDSNA